MSEPETPYKIQSESPMKRYFFVSYMYETFKGVSGTSSFTCFTHGTFMNNSEVIDIVKEKNDYEKVVITNIFEFKSEKDYNEFIAE